MTATRIPPAADPAIEVLPPCGGSWVRDADGGLTPADESTALAAGLAWGTHSTDTTDTE